jgi:hypothetical protein
MLSGECRVFISCVCWKIGLCQGRYYENPCRYFRYLLAMNTRSAAMVSLLPTYHDVRSSAERSRTHEFYTSSISSHRHQVSVSTAGAWKIMADLRMPAGISWSSPFREAVPPRRDRSICGVPPSVNGLVYSRSVYTKVLITLNQKQIITLYTFIVISTSCMPQRRRTSTITQCSMSSFETVSS